MNNTTNELMQIGLRLSNCRQDRNMTQEELAGKKHNFELIPSGHTVLCLDYGQSGIGSNSCGPQLARQYQLDEEAFCYRLRLIPFRS